MMRSIGRGLGGLPGVFDLVIDPRLRSAGITGIQNDEWAGRPRQFDLRDYTQRKAYFACFERAESAFFRRTVRPGATCIDVGANVGLVTTQLAALVGTNGRVLALEPVPSNAAVLSQSVEGLPQVSCVFKAASDVDGASVSLGRVSGGDSDAAATSGSFSMVAESGHGADVQATTRRLETLIPELLGSGAQTIDLVKIDVEGAEGAVLAGLGPLLNRRTIRVLVLEAVAVRAGGFRGTDAEVMRTLRSAGYTLHPIGLNGRPLRESPERWIRSLRRWPRYGHLLVPSISVNYCAL